MENIFITKIIKIGNSCGLVIPQEILNGFHWQRGDTVVFGFASQGQLYIKKMSDLEMKDLKPHDIT